MSEQDWIFVPAEEKEEGFAPRGILFGLLCSLPFWVLVVAEWAKGILR